MDDSAKVIVLFVATGDQRDTDAPVGVYSSLIAASQACESDPIIRRRRISMREFILNEPPNMGGVR